MLHSATHARSPSFVDEHTTESSNHHFSCVTAEHKLGVWKANGSQQHNAGESLNCKGHLPRRGTKADAPTSTQRTTQRSTQRNAKEVNTPTQGQLSTSKTHGPSLHAGTHAHARNIELGLQLFPCVFLRVSAVENHMGSQIGSHMHPESPRKKQKGSTETPERTLRPARGPPTSTPGRPWTPPRASGSVWGWRPGPSGNDLWSLGVSNGSVQDALGVSG